VSGMRRRGGVVHQERRDQEKLEIIGPGVQKVVDVAVRLQGDSSCYIHTPENFIHERYRPPANEVGVGTHRATVVIESDDYRTEPFRFRIVNEGGTDPGLLSLENR